MPEITVTLSANAGVALDIDGRRLWVDALHEKKEECYSSVTPQLQQKMMGCEAFFHPEYICYTHNHGDHYSARLTQTACSIWPNARVLSPETVVDGVQYTAEDRGLTLRFIRLPHEGERFADVKHYGLMISYHGCNILIPGDCAVASPLLDRAIEGITVDLVLLDFPWLTLKRGSEFVYSHFRESHVIVYHLPFEEDDVIGYRPVAQRTVRGLKKPWDVRILQDPLQSETFNI